MIRFRLPRRGSYKGRLAFDGYYHTDPAGRRLVTDDQGLSWRYANRNDTPHNMRYETRVAVVTATTAADPHHVHPTEDDPHFLEGATDVDGKVTHTRLLADLDVVGPRGRRVHATVAKQRLIGRSPKLKRIATDEIERGDPTSTSHTETYRV